MKYFFDKIWFSWKEIDPNVHLKYKCGQIIPQLIFGAKYYRCIAAAVRAFKVTNFLELGVREGACSLLVSQQCNVDALDTDWFNWAVYEKPSNLNTFNVKEEDCLTWDYSKYQMALIDIDHSGKYEWRIHEKLRKEFKGIAFWDDIGIGNMQDVWRDIKEKKISLDWHNSGFGAVFYGN